LSYHEQNGQVLLTMSREDFDHLLIVFGAASAAFLARAGDLADVLALLNRLNEGNPNYTPYQVKA